MYASYRRTGFAGYRYDPFGNVTRTTDPRGNQISVGYDNLGRKTQLLDPDLGAWLYSVNPLGQTYSQTDAKGQTTTFTFDALGRVTHRLENDLDSYWVYDTAPKGVGKLAEAYTWISGTSTKDYQRIYAYDSLGRAASTTTRLDADYVEEYGYDGFGRQNTTTYRRNAVGGSGGPYNALTASYNAQGYNAQLTRSDGTTSATVWTAQTEDAQGQVTQQQLGNGLVTRRGYNAYSGRLESIATGPDANSATQQSDAYSYDSLGNLASRTQMTSTGGAALAELLAYDNLNRLTSSVVIGQAQKNYSYDAIGNLSAKDGVGTYAYGASGTGSVRPHAVASITGAVAGVTNPGFSYDANGNLIDGLNRHYGWTSYNQATTVDKMSAGSATQRTAFIFGPDHQRTRQTVSPMSGGAPGAAIVTIYYADSIEKEINTATNTTTIRTYFGAAGYVEEQVAGTNAAATASGTRNARYFLTDHLGSAIAVVDANQTVLQRMGYDAWGRRRNTDGTDDASASLGSISNANDHTGYTGQEQLDQLGLVHLNGRIYDPITGRFISADPTIPDAHDAQSLNRYSYVLNNPFLYTDPSGFDNVALERLERVPVDGRCGVGCQNAAEMLTSLATSMARGTQRNLLFVFRVAGVARPILVRAGVRAGLVVLYSGGPENLVGDGIAAGLATATVIAGIWEAMHSDSGAKGDGSDAQGTNSEEGEVKKPTPEAPYPNNPDNSDFDRINGGKGAKQNPEDGSVWERDKSQHGSRDGDGDQWKRWPDKRSWEKGEKPNSVWPDGRIRK